LDIIHQRAGWGGHATPRTDASGRPLSGSFQVIDSHCSAEVGRIWTGPECTCCIHGSTLWTVPLRAARHLEQRRRRAASQAR
jgi:hypothetical protein